MVKAGYGPSKQTNAVIPEPERNLQVRLAQSEADLKVAQSLRWRAFYDELGARPDTVCVGQDGDPFDTVCDHLLVEDTGSGTPEPVGTGCLLRHSVPLAQGGFSMGHDAQAANRPCCRRAKISATTR
jgi:putative hemolysin